MSVPPPARSTRFQRLPEPLPLPACDRFPPPGNAPVPASRRSCHRRARDRGETKTTSWPGLPARVTRHGSTRRVPSQCDPGISHRCIASRGSKCPCLLETRPASIVELPLGHVPCAGGFHLARPVLTSTV